MNKYLEDNPEFRVKIKIAFERMLLEKKEDVHDAVYEELRMGRKDQAMAVVEAAYSKISKALRG